MESAPKPVHRHALLGSVSQFSREELSKVYEPIDNREEVASIDEDGHQPTAARRLPARCIREAVHRNDEPERVVEFVLELSHEIPNPFRRDHLHRPPSLDKKGLAIDSYASVDLFAFASERPTRLEIVK